MRRPLEIVPVPPKDTDHGKQGDGGVEQSGADKDAGAVGEKIKRLEQEGTQLPLADLGRDLPLVLRGGDQVVDQQNNQEVEDHLSIIVARDQARGVAIDGPPDKDGPEERDQGEEGAQQEVPAVDKGVLQADGENGPVFIENIPDHVRQSG